MKKLKTLNLIFLFITLNCATTKFNTVLAQSSNLTISNFDELVNLSNPKISPDGTKVLVITRAVNIEKNKYENMLWLVDLKLKKVVSLIKNRPSVSQPNWSPKGDYISFLAKGENNKPQIFKLSINNEEAEQITNSPQGVMRYKWSPNGLLFAYLQKDPPIENANKHNKSFEVGYDWYLAEKAARPTHIWICSNEGTNNYQITEGESGFSSLLGNFEWSQNNKEIVFVQQPKPHSSEFLNSSLQLINIESKETTLLDDGIGAPAEPSFSKDGTILYSKAIGGKPGFNAYGLFLVNNKGENIKFISQNLDRNIVDHVWVSNNEFLVAAPDETNVGLWRGNLNGKFKKLNTNNVIPSIGRTVKPLLNNLDVGSSGEIVFIGSTSQEASEVYFMKDSESTPEKITSFNESFSQLKLGKANSIDWETEDGFNANGVITYPPGFSLDKKYPLVLYIHGGPMGFSSQSFNFFAQALAAEGWIVFEPNYRGSNNLGNTYQSAVINDAGEGPGKDVMAGIDTIKKLGFIDDDKIAISGWSYGGFMTVWLTSHYHGWKAAVAGAAVTDWFDWYNMADLNKWSGLGLGGSPWLNNNAEKYRRQSPITYAHQIKTPTLIMSNTLDPRVSVSQSYKLFHNLKDNGVETKFIAYPISGHFPQDPVHTKDVYRRWIEWIKTHL